MTVWAVHAAIKNQHRLDKFSTKVRLAVIFLGAARFFAALHFIGSGLSGMYVALPGGLTSGLFLFFPDASFYLGRYLQSKVINNSK